MGEAVFAYFGAVGIRCKLRGLEYNAWLTMVRHNPDGSSNMDGIINAMYGHGLPGDPGMAWAQTLHSTEPGKGWGASSYSNDKEVDALIEQQQAEMDPVKREAIVRHIAHLKHERILGGLSAYRPLQTFAWRDKVAFVPWAMPGIWHQMQQVGFVH
jgi:peptide/nickel transport system substrate-binding protein